MIKNKQPADGTQATTPGRTITVVVIALLAVAFLAFAAFAFRGYVSANADVEQEEAITQAPEEAQIAAREVLTAMFTFDYQNVDGKLTAVLPKLTDPVLSDFRENSMPQVSSSTKEQQASVFATIAAIGTMEIVDADTVKLLVMLNRMTSTKDQKAAQDTGSRIAVTMVRGDNGEWLLSELLPQ